MIRFTHHMPRQIDLSIPFIDEYRDLSCNGPLTLVNSTQESKGMFAYEFLHHLHIVFFEIRKIIHAAKVLNKYKRTSMLSIRLHLVSFRLHRLGFGVWSLTLGSRIEILLNNLDVINRYATPEQGQTSNSKHQTDRECNVSIEAVVNKKNAT